MDRVTPRLEAVCFVIDSESALSTVHLSTRGQPWTRMDKVKREAKLERPHRRRGTNPTKWVLPLGGFTLHAIKCETFRY